MLLACKEALCLGKKSEEFLGQRPVSHSGWLKHCRSALMYHLFYLLLLLILNVIQLKVMLFNADKSGITEIERRKP